jgi:glutamine amidotransferase
MNQTPTVALFDYGAGNLHSLQKALEAGGAGVVITGNWELALSRDALVLPGVGSFGAAVRSLEGQRDRVREALARGLPCLGICLGMQLFFEVSEEGPGAGICFLPGRVRMLRSRLIPQMGWNDVTPVNRTARVPGSERSPATDPIFEGTDKLVAYFANSYVCDPVDPGQIIAITEHQGDSFPAGVREENTWGVQFHPEKSSAPGLKLIKNFLGEIRN